MKSILYFLLISWSVVTAAGWEKTDLIWDFGLISQCDRGFNENPRLYFQEEPLFSKSRYEGLKAGEVAFVHCCYLKRFHDEVVPHLDQPIIVLVSDGDETFPSEGGEGFDFQRFINEPMIGHVFAQNCVVQHPKVTQIPIGIDFHTVAYKGDGGWGERGNAGHQERVLKQVFAGAKPTSQRQLGAFVDFQHSDTMHGGFKRYLQHGEDRRQIFRRLKRSGLLAWSGFLRRYLLWEKKVQFAFSISPHGNGLDCHRTWEDLALGCIVIVKRSPLDPLYRGLPVVIVDDWSEVTFENLEKWRNHFGDVSHNPEVRSKLTTRYWWDLVDAKSKELRGD